MRGFRGPGERIASGFITVVKGRVFVFLIPLFLLSEILLTDKNTVQKYMIFIQNKVIQKI